MAEPPLPVRRASLPIVVDDASTSPDAGGSRAAQRRDDAALRRANDALAAHRLDDARRELLPLVQRGRDDGWTPTRVQAGLLWSSVLLMVGLAAHARLVVDEVVPHDDASRSLQAVLASAACRAVGLLDDALGHAQRAVDVDATAEALLARAEVHKAAGRLDAAIDDARAALARDPDHLAALALLAGFLQLRGDVAEATSVYARFDALADDGADACRNAAFFFATCGEADKTLACLQSAWGQDPIVTRAWMRDEPELRRFVDDKRFAELWRAVASIDVEPTG